MYQKRLFFCFYRCMIMIMMYDALIRGMNQIKTKKMMKMNPLSLCSPLVAISKNCQALSIQMFVHAFIGNVFVILLISEMLNILYVVLGMQYCSIFANGVRFCETDHW